MSGKAYWIGMGDIHGHTANIGRIPGLAGAAGVIISGDLTIKGGVAEASRVIEAVAAVNPRILAQIGNMDHEPVQAWLDEKGMGIHARVVELAPGLGLMGVGWSSPTPFHTPSEVPDAQLGQWLDQAWERAKAFDHVILVSHTPPHATAADRVGSGAHVGSAAVRAFIERAQPDVCLTGHIHESRGTDSLGRTVVVNSGDLASGGYVVIEYDGRSVTAALKTVA
jgi:Icc-related predicted phosphoesterase